MEEGVSVVLFLKTASELIFFSCLLDLYNFDNVLQEGLTKHKDELL